MREYAIRTFTGAAVVMTLLAAEVRHEKALRTFGMTFAGSQLPALRTSNAFVSTWTDARHAAQKAFGARSVLVVVTASIYGEKNLP